MEFVVTIGLAVATAGAVMSYRSRARSRWWLTGGALLVVVGIAAATWGFGYAWMASMDGSGAAPGVIAFVAGLGGTFAGLGILAGRAARAAHPSADRPGVTERRPGAAPLVITALTSFLASQTCLVLYLNDHLEGSTGVFAAVFISLTLVAAWILGALALRAAGRRGAVAFLLVAPWPILAVDVITFAFSASLAVYVITGVAAVFVIGLGLELMPARGRPPNRTVAP